MKKFNCPSCGAETIFQSNLSVYAICKHCSSMIVRQDVNVESIGNSAVLPDDMSPLQIGTSGSYEGQHFVIVGRIKIGWKDGIWNEWFLVMDDGSEAWLAEAQGSYAISFEIENFVKFNNDKNFISLIDKTKEHIQKASSYTNLELDNNIYSKLGSYVNIYDKRFKINDIKRTICIGSEGELPFMALKGQETISIDLSNQESEFGNIEISDDNCKVFIGSYTEWTDMQCQNFRLLEGW